jgi:hypothetical protein
MTTKKSRTKRRSTKKARAALMEKKSKPWEWHAGQIARLAGLPEAEVLHMIRSLIESQAQPTGDDEGMRRRGEQRVDAPIIQDIPPGKRGLHFPEKP